MGRPLKWGFMRRHELKVAVDELVQAGRSEIHACRQLASTEKWCHWTASTLHRRYKEHGNHKHTLDFR